MTLTTATPLEAALSYAELGWPVVPLHTPKDGVCDCPKRADCPSPGKHPRTMHGLDDATTDETKISMWWGPKMWPHANIGIDLAKANLVDVAPDSLEWQAEFIARGLPRTPAFRSGGGDGHEHHLFRRPEVCPPYRLCRTDEFDLLSAGYAVMPPSLHVSGLAYAWTETPESARLANAPIWAVQMLRENAKRPAGSLNGTAPAVAPGEPPVQLHGEDLRVWRGELVKLKPGGTVDRSMSLWDIGCALSRAGATRQTIAHALQERDESLGWSKYTGRRDAQTRYLVLADRVLSGQGPRIRLKAAEAQTEHAATTTRRFRLITADELKNRPDPEWLVDGVLQKDTLALLVGAQETLKTFTALDMALSVATDIDWQGYPVKASGVAIYVSSEGGSGLGLRVAAWEKAHGVEVGSRCLFLADQAPQLLDRKNGGDVDELIASIRELDVQPAFIVVDTAARAMVGGDENSAQDMGLFIASADQIRQATGAVVLLVHHNNKGGSARGSTALTGAVHTIIESSREENSKYLILKCGKQKDADHFESLMVETEVVDLGANETTGVIRTSLVLNRRSNVIRIEQQSTQLSSTGRAMLLALIELGEASFSQWQSACGLAKTTFLRTKTMLIEDGYVHHVIDRYRPSESGKAIGSKWVHGGSTDPNGPEAEMGATEGSKIGSTPGAPLGECPVDPLDPRGPSARTGPDQDLPW